jgi:hypothetical protein
MSATLLDRDESLAPTIKGIAIGRPAAWWTQRHSWIFAGLILANVVVTWPLVRAFILLDGGASGLWANAVAAGLMGACIGQLYLASIWLAFGGLPTSLRFGAALTAVVLGTVNAAFGVSRDPVGTEMTLCLGVALLIVLQSQLVLAPVRWLTGWRIDFDPAYHKADEGGRMQLRLWHYLALTFLATLPLIVYRTLDALSPTEDAGNLAITAALLAAMTVLVAAPVSWLVLVRRRPIVAWLSVPVGFVMAGALGYVATVAMASEQGQSVSELVFLFTLPAGALALVALNLILLRIAGLHLFSVKLR